MIPMEEQNPPPVATTGQSQVLEAAFIDALRQSIVRFVKIRVFPSLDDVDPALEWFTSLTGAPFSAKFLAYFPVQQFISNIEKDRRWPRVRVENTRGSALRMDGPKLETLFARPGDLSTIREWLEVQFPDSLAADPLLSGKSIVRRIVGEERKGNLGDNTKDLLTRFAAHITRTHQLISINALKKQVKFWNETVVKNWNFWRAEDQCLEECVHVLVRLTERADGALVLLWDLIDERDYDRFLILREIFGWAARQAAPPVPYDPVNAVFTKVSGTFRAIEDLMRAFTDWDAGRGKRG